MWFGIGLIIGLVAGAVVGLVVAERIGLLGSTPKSVNAKTDEHGPYIDIY